MSKTVYNKPNSSVYHENQRCGGTFFPAMAAISKSAAENRGLRPCSRCVDE